MNYVVRLIGVLFAELIKNANFDECLMMESLLVANNFDCHILIGFVIQCPYDLPKATLANYFQYLIAIADVIMNNLIVVNGRLKLTVHELFYDTTHFIIASIIIVITTIQWRARLCVDFARVESQIPNFWVLFNFLFLIVTQLTAVLLNDLCGS